MLGKKHIRDTAADLVDMCAIRADHLTFNDVDLRISKAKGEVLSQLQFFAISLTSPLIRPLESYVLTSSST